MSDEQPDDPAPQPVHILIDGSHVHMVARSMMDARGAWDRQVNFDYLAMHQAILSHGDKPRTAGSRCAIIHSQPPPRRTAFLCDEDAATLKQLGYSNIALPLHVRRVDCHSCGREWDMHREKAVDAELVSSMLDIAGAIAFGQLTGLIALVSSDGDFHRAITIARQRFGVPVEVWGFSQYLNVSYAEDALITGTLDEFVSMPKQRKVVGSRPARGHSHRHRQALQDEAEEDVA